MPDNTQNIQNRQIAYENFASTLKAVIPDPADREKILLLALNYTHCVMVEKVVEAQNALSVMRWVRPPEIDAAIALARLSRK